MLPTDALRLGTPEISTLNRETGSTEIGKLVFETAIVSILEFYGAEWSSSVIRELAELMHSEYYWFHLAELKLFTVKAKKGQYNRKEWIKDNGEMIEYDGKIYGKLEPKVLLIWIDRYANESLVERSNNFINSGGRSITEQKLLTAGQPEGKQKVPVDPKDLEQAHQVIKEFTERMRPRYDELEEDVKQQRIKLMQQQAMPSQRVRPLDIAAFAARIVRGEKMTQPDDIQFYNNNASEIEMCIKLNYSQNVS